MKIVFLVFFIVSWFVQFKLLCSFLRFTGYLDRFEFDIFLRVTAHGRTGGAVSMSDSTDPPIGSPSASALPSAGGRGRAGCLPKRGVRVGVNG